ncbi:hypothetical protein Patl1_04854 [Pistacia atlantica]|uniref:Uncharacterized protein n=1 Tax=Pistacia atlantica TaxID=434234 RepID=A0ACC1BQS6_9ROSI|nr:hypothetical protein Patl1_04854 [Pistacia atlantica]
MFLTLELPPFPGGSSRWNFLNFLAVPHLGTFSTSWQFLTLELSQLPGLSDAKLIPSNSHLNSSVLKEEINMLTDIRQKVVSLPTKVASLAVVGVEQEGGTVPGGGIPWPEVHLGCKIILTSRSLDICRDMNMKTDVDIKMDILNGDEAWQLFCQSAGHVASLGHIKPFAEAICTECCDLPLAIISVGMSMRGKTKVELWRNALSELQKSGSSIRGIENKVFKPLKLSNDLLRGNTIKSCFLFCWLYPEDFSIEINELVQCCLVKVLLDECSNHDELLNRGISIVEYLKDSCLLEHGDREDA